MVKNTRDEPSWYIKPVALTTVLLLSVGSHFSASAISALKTTVKKELGIDNTSYGLLSSSISLLNTVLPMIGGRVMDKCGARVSTVSATTLILIGSLLTTLAAQYRLFSMMIVGRLVFGLGSGVIVTLQETILTSTFSTHLALAIGLQLASSQISGFVGTLTANPLANRLGWVGVFWIAFGLCVFSALMNFIYLSLVPPPLSKKKAAKVSFIGVVWLIIAIEAVLCMVWAPFQIIVTEYVMMQGNGAVEAGIMASVSQVVPIVLTPILGMVMDRWGRRVSLLATCVLCLELCCVFLGYFTTSVPVVVGMVLFSVSMALGPLAMLTSLGILLPPDSIGIGLGVFKSANSAGSTVMDILVGVIQDHTQSYQDVWLVFIIITALGGLLVVALVWLQARFYGNVLERPAGWSVAVYRDDSNKTRWRFVVPFIALILLAWILFFVFTVHGHVKPG